MERDGGRLERVIFDLHGVLIGRDPASARELPAAEVIRRLRGRGRAIAFITNSSSSGPEGIAKQLAAHGIAAALAETFSAGMAMAAYLKERHAGARVLCIGQGGLRQLIEEAVGTAALCDRGEEAEVVVVGRDPALSAELLAEAARAGRRAVLLATSREPTFPVDGGEQVGPGATVARVEEAMGVRAQTIGKPNPFLLERLVGLHPEDMAATLLVGDSPETDLALGRATGCPTALIGARHPEATFHLDHLEELLSLPGLALQ